MQGQTVEWACLEVGGVGAEKRTISEELQCQRIILDLSLRARGRR